MEKEYDMSEVEISQEILPEQEAIELARIEREFLESYVASKDKMPVKEWLQKELHKQLPDYTENDIQQISEEIVISLAVTEDLKTDQNKAIEMGKDKESWFASKIQQFTSHMSAQEGAKYLHKYLQGLDDAVENANNAMQKVILTKASNHTVVSQNMNLDGFIAEQYHANSFNMDAAAKGSGLRAEVQPLKPGETYSKNGFDVIVRNEEGMRIHQYQMKFGATAEDTIRMLRSGNYNNQILIVPQDQVDAVQKAFPNKTVMATIKIGKVESKPLTKAQAKQMQEEAQKGNFSQLEWNDYSTKDIAIGISKKVGYSCLQGAAIGAGMTIASKVWNGETIEGGEVVEAALVSGADFGVKTAVAGALQVASEKGKIPFIPKGTNSSVFTNIAFVAVEDAKVAWKVAKGDLSIHEGIDVMQQTTGSCVLGLTVSTKGATWGGIIGGFLGPAGAVVGGFLGGAVGYMAGSKVGESVVKGYQKIRDKAKEGLKSVGRAISNTAKNMARGVASLFGF